MLSECRKKEVIPADLYVWEGPEDRLQDIDDLYHTLLVKLHLQRAYGEDNVLFMCLGFFPQLTET